MYGCGRLHWRFGRKDGGENGRQGSSENALPCSFPSSPLCPLPWLLLTAPLLDCSRSFTVLFSDTGQLSGFQPELSVWPLSPGARQEPETTLVILTERVQYKELFIRIRLLTG